MKQTGLFDWQTRFEQLDNGGDPLAKLNEVVNWEMFRQNLEKARNTDPKSPAGPCINGPGARLAVPKNQKFKILRSKIYSKYVNETFEPYKSNY